VIRADANDSVNLGAGWAQAGVQSIDDEFYDVFQQGVAEVLILRSEGPTWRNPVDPLDVNNDGFVVPIDALVIINELADRVISSSTGLLPSPPEPPNLPPPFLDPTGDGFVSPLDALQVINFLNNPEAEGEAAESSFAHALPLLSLARLHPAALPTGKGIAAELVAYKKESQAGVVANISRDAFFSDGLAEGGRIDAAADDLLESLQWLW
jgi:hypothetical protein